jgi:seryl-tRNA synthetase
MAAILENYQQSDGSVEMPKALVPYLGFSAIAVDGSLVS